MINGLAFLTETESLGDVMARAGINTVMGITIVVVTLVAISLIISLEGKIFVAIDKAKAKRKEVVKQEETPAAVAEEVEEVDDEEEIAAVITAAIYAYEAETGIAVPADGLVVRSIRRRR